MKILGQEIKSINEINDKLAVELSVMTIESLREIIRNRENDIGLPYIMSLDFSDLGKGIDEFVSVLKEIIKRK